jgi:hypothetical protein
MLTYEGADSWREDNASVKLSTVLQIPMESISLSWSLFNRRRMESFQNRKVSLPRHGDGCEPASLGREHNFVGAPADFTLVYAVKNSLLSKGPLLRLILLSRIWMGMRFQVSCKPYGGASGMEIDSAR